MSFVVRAGEAKAADLIQGYAPHRLVPGLYGFSVQYAPGKSVDELVQAGQFPNATVSYEDEAALANAIAPLGYRLRLVSSPGKGYHHTFCVLYDASNTLQTTLPVDVAQALASTFRRMPNRYRVPRRQPSHETHPGRLQHP